MKFNLKIKLNIKTAIFIFWILYFISVHIKTGNANLYFPVAIIGLLIFFSVIRKNIEFCRLSIKPILIIILGGFISILYVGNIQWYNMFFLIGHIGIAMALAVSKESLVNTYKKIFVFLIVIYALYFAMNHSFSGFYNLASENMVSIYLILFFYFYCRESITADRKISICAAICVLIFSYYSGSRTGFACSIILVVGILLIKILEMRGGDLFIVLLTIIGVFAVSSIIFFGLSFVKEILNNAPRMYIWNLYIDVNFL